MKIAALVRSAYALLVRVASSLQSPFLLVIRLYWGWSFFQTGYGKLQDLSKPIEFFTSLNIPFPAVSAVLASTTECVGGLCILVGLASRLVALPLIFTMIVAYITTEGEALHALFVDHDPDKFLSATPFQFLFAILIVLIFGPGLFSIDHLLSKKFGNKVPASPAPPVSP
jgi:putative oxidoreductase